jgi:hypothetical protein
MHSNKVAMQWAHSTPLCTRRGVPFAKNNKISFLAIAKIIQYTLDTVQHTDVPSLEAVIANVISGVECAHCTATLFECIKCLS